MPLHRVTVHRLLSTAPLILEAIPDQYLTDVHDQRGISLLLDSTKLTMGPAQRKKLSAGYVLHTAGQFPDWQRTGNHRFQMLSARLPSKDFVHL